jgi:YebC/PmpR family DNA-binding regulatory protein
MSGHSKWSTIKRQKETTDQKRGQTFSKLARGIAVAARSGSDPESNFKLRLLIEKAKAVNMPKDNIERAIDKGSGEGGEGKLEEIVYEGYGPAGVAVIVEAVTDNRNRTTAEIKNIFERGGGSLTGPGAVAYQFKKAGLITIKKTATPEEEILKIMDLGVEDVEEVEDAVEVNVSPDKIEDIRGKLKETGFEVIGVEMVMEPKILVKVDDPGKATKVLNFMEALQSHDDIQQVYANFDIPAGLVNV